MKVEKMGDGIYNAFDRANKCYGVGHSHLEAIRKCLSQITEVLYEEYVSYLESFGSSPHNIIYTDEGVGFVAEGNPKSYENTEDRSYPLPEKYHQFV